MKKLKNKKVHKPSKLAPSEQRELEKQIRKMLGQGKTDGEIVEKLNCQPHVLVMYKQRIVDIDREHFESMDNAKVYSNFCLRSEQNIRDLDEIKLKFKNRGQWTALVAAVKQKHEIQKDMFKMGQELGYIEKRANEIKVENEISFATMSASEVKAAVEMERQKLNDLVGMNVIEMRPELMDVLNTDVDAIKRFVPKNVTIPGEFKEVREKKDIKIKIKQKIKLRK